MTDWEPEDTDEPEQCVDCGRYRLVDFRGLCEECHDASDASASN